MTETNFRDYLTFLFYKRFKPPKRIRI